MRLLLIALCACGRLGFEARIADDSAVDSPAPSGFTAIVAYADQTCAVYEARLYCWGANGQSQLGDGGVMDRGTPTAVGVPAGAIASFAQGEKHGCAVVDATLYCWGAGFAATPAAVALPAAARVVDAGQSFTCALADRLYCWGDNSEARLGDGTTTPRSVPTPVATAIDVVDLDTGDDHGCAVGSGGEVECWGHNDSGALGTGSFTPTVEMTPVAVIGGVTTLPRIAGWHACNLQAGEVRCWGRNTEGELGDGTTMDSASPIVVTLPPIDTIATGGGPADRDATCAAAGGEVHCWGAGGFGRLGDGQTENRPLPTSVAGLPGTSVRALALGYAHSCALLVDGELWCWGRGDAGQLGDGTFSDSLIPVRVVPPSA